MGSEMCIRDRPVEAADELIEDITDITDIAHALGAPWAFRRMLSIRGVPVGYRMHPELHALTRQRPDILHELFEEATR